MQKNTHQNTPRYFHLAALGLAMSLAGCVTTQGGSSSLLPQLQPVKLDLASIGNSIGDVLSPQLREFKRLVNESKFVEAEEYFNMEAIYFEQRYTGAKQAPEEFTKLAEYVWLKSYQDKAEQATQELKAVDNLANPAKWSQVSKALKNGEQVTASVKQNFLFTVAQFGEAQTQELAQQIARVVQLAEASKPDLLAAKMGSILATGEHNPVFVGKVTIDANDYLASDKFQATALAHLAAQSDRDAYLKDAVKLTPYLTEPTRRRIDSAYVEMVRTQLLADGRISLEEVSTLGSVRAPFGGSTDAIARLATIGYVDLTSASFKGRNLFDFAISFTQDSDLKFAPATEAVFTSGDLSRFDYLFVTDLNAAKVAREFKNKREMKSRIQTGVWQGQNPEYIAALADYQTAMAEFQRAQISSAIPKACAAGWGCALQGFADGLSNATARQSVERASARLAGTSQTISRPVYSDYAYQAVDVSSTKTADVNYYVIDVKRKRILKNSFQINDNEVFNVAYNLRDDDPDKASIQRNVTSEEEVTAWEKRPAAVPISALFNAKNLGSATTTPYTDIQAFLKTLNTRSYAAAAPTYSNAGERSAKAAPAPAPTSSRSATSQTIADARFDSVLVIGNPNNGGIGTGFYVTPELVLTAYHVVEGSSLVEMAYYDGSKTYGRVVDYDARLDLALIKAQQTGKPLSIHSGPLKLGETVEAIGHPKGYTFTITRGVISAARRQRSATIASDNLVEFIQTDTPISPGNSGGPLLLKDTVIGVNDWIRVDQGAQNLNFSVSYNEIRSYLDRFKGK